MSGYSGRKGPNVSQYLANLNAVPSAQEIAAQQDENFNFEDDLAIFTNTEFFDFDSAFNAAQRPVEYDASQDEAVKQGHAPVQEEAVKNLGFDNAGFAFPRLNTFIPQDPTTNSIQPVYPTYVPPTQSFALDTTPHPQKRPLDTAFPISPTATTPLSESSRAAAEEDKRRRNTAASARFRVKKKAREQALERTNKELVDKATAMETRMGQLETENKWLRTLVTEKTGRADVGELVREMRVEDARSSEEGKKGVGTEV